MTTLNINTIRTAGTISGAAGQRRRRRNYSELIGDDSRCTGFFSLLEGRYTFQSGGAHDGLVSQITNRKTASSLVLAEAVSTAMPTLDIDVGPDAGDGPTAAMRFFASGSDKLTASAAFPVSGDHFKAFVFRSAGASTTKYLGYSGTSGNRHMMHLGGTNTLFQRVGASGAEANASVAFPVDQWNIGIGCWNHAAKRVAVSVNGGSWVTDTDAAAVLDEVAFVVSGGFLADDWISDIIYGSADLSASANDSYLDTILAWARDKRGIAL